MFLLLCAFVLLSTLLSSGRAFDTHQNKEQGREWDAVVRLSDGRTVTCDWGDWGKCSRNRRGSGKKCFRKSKMCTDGSGKNCKKICVMDPYDHYESCTKSRSCRDKWGLSRKRESKECSCVQEVSFRRAWMMQNPWLRRRH